MQPMESIVEREIARWQLNRAAAERLLRAVVPAPLITISRQLGSGGAELARTLGTRLHWPVYDRELVDEMVLRSHASRQLVLDLDEDIPSGPVRWLDVLITQELFDYDDYRAILLQVLNSLAERGSAIILGRGANFAARPHPRLDVRIVAPMQVRIERLARRDGLTPTQASLVIHRSDQQRREFTRRVYHANWDDASQYDLIINTGHLSILEAAELVEDALKDLNHIVRSPSA